MFEESSSPLPSGDAGAPPEAPPEQSVWTPDGNAEPQEAEATNPTNNNDNGVPQASFRGGDGNNDEVSVHPETGERQTETDRPSSSAEDKSGRLELGSKPSAERQPERPPERRMSSSNANRHKIFIGGITSSITDEILYQHFEQFGAIEKANVIRDNTGKSRGFGFVQFQSMDSVAVAVEASPHQLDADNRVDAQPAQDRGARRPPGRYPSPYYDQSYYGYGYGGAAGPYGYHAAAAAYSPMYTPNPYGAYAGYGGSAGYYAGGYGDAYGTAEGGGAYGAVRRGEGSYSSGSRSARGAPY